MELRQRSRTVSDDGDLRGTISPKTSESSYKEEVSFHYYAYSRRGPALLLLAALLSLTLFYSSSDHATTESGQSPSKPRPSNSSSSSTTSSSPTPLKTPHCLLHSTDAIRALSRAKTQGCRHEISLIACRSQNRSLYSPGPLPNHCPSRVDPELAGTHLGCYRDSLSTRLLPDKLFKFKENNGPTKCMEACTFYGFPYAGLQYVKECFCGRVRPQKEEAIPGDKCDLPCPKPEDGICGGYLSMNVYHTGVLLPLESNEEEGMDPSETPSPVRIVFLLTLSGRSIRQIKRLLRRIYSPHHYYLIHIDSRQVYLHRKLSVLSHHNLRLLPRRFPTIWGGSSLLSMLLYAMEYLLHDSEWSSWDYLLNLSESDYPIQPLGDLTAFLSRNRGKNFLKSHGRDASVFIQKQGLERTFLECENRMWRIGNRELPGGITLDGGSDWICLHHDFIQHLINNMKTDPQLAGLRQLYNYTLLPAESFFHTALRNSAFCPSYVNNNLHLTNWKRKLGCKCQHKAVVDWCGCSPNDITPRDWAKVQSASEKDIYFVRKVEPVVSQSVLDLIDSQLLHITGEAMDDRYWQNIWHHRDPEDGGPEKPLAQALLSTKAVTLQEISSFHRNDSLEGILVLYKDSENTIGEAFIVPKRLSQDILLENSDSLSLEVGSAFDPKELIFRDFFNAFGPRRPLGVKMSYRSSKDRGVKLLWVDPLGSLVKSLSSKLNVSRGNDLSAHYEELGSPDTSGLWRVIPLLDGVVQRGISFWVMMYPGDSPSSMERSHFSNGSTLISLAFPKESLELPHGLSDFYKLRDTCSGARDCASRDWSSLTPDQKSAFS